MNRDIEVLKRVRFAMQDVVMAQERYEWEKDHLFSMTQKITGMPRGGGVPKDTADKIGEIEVKLDAYAEMSKVYREELREAERVLNSCSNANIRTFCVMAYVMGIGWEEVRRRLNMTEYAVKRLRDAVESAERLADVEMIDR